MKTIYSLLALLLFISLSSTLKSETKTWIGPDGYWSNELKWSPAGVPIYLDDVIIPVGLTLDVDIDNAKCQTITVNAGATMDITGNLQIFDDSIFALGSIVDFVSGTITCTSGAILTVVGQLNLTSDLDKEFSGGVIDIVGSMHKDNEGGEWVLGGSHTLKISPSGIFSMDGDVIAQAGAWSNYFVNEGTLVKTAGSGSLNFTNLNSTMDGGTITVESGSIDFNYQVFLKNGSAINVAESAALNFNDRVNVEGELTGELNGTASMLQQIYVIGEEAGVFNFSGSLPLYWGGTGNLIGDQTLINYSTLEIIGANILNSSTLINYGIINHNSEDNLTLGNQNALFENKAGATLNFINSGGMDGYFGPNNLINEGLLTIDNGNGYHSFSPVVTNLNGGIINTGDDGVQFGRFFGDGMFNVYGSFQVASMLFSPFEGTMKLGGEGIENIMCTSNFYSDSTAIFNIQINGPNPGTDYDVLTIDGLVNIKGDFDIELGYEPVMDDEFEIMTFNNTYEDCALPETVSTTFEGNTYVFDVLCSDTEVVLKVSDIVLSIDDLSSNFAPFLTYPNPTVGNFSLQFEKTISHMDIVVSDLLGNIIDVKQLKNTSKMDFYLDGSSGIYFLTLTDQKGLTRTIKVVKA